MQDKLCFVQFMHPGQEHRCGKNALKEWNRSAHKRKFVENRGRCIKEGRQHEGLLRFWCEWEPQSETIAEIPEPLSYGPKSVCKPFYVVPKSYQGLQNTDPFVFDGFFYTLCRQHKWSKQYERHRPTQLRHLERGSVILFGSHVGGQFALDTVFVVDRWEDHDSSNFERLIESVPEGYWDVTLAAWYKPTTAQCGSNCSPPNSDLSYRLYWGATQDKPFDGMFSYFPCQPAERCPNGFSRPLITIPGIVNPQLKMGFRLNRTELTRSRVHECWTKVRDQVEDAELRIGVWSEMPERRASLR